MDRKVDSSDGKVAEAMPGSRTTSAKSTLRVAAKAARAHLSPELRQSASQAIATHAVDFLPQPPPHGAIVGGFMPIGEEISPLPLMARLRAGGYRLALPVMMSKGQPLQFRAYTPGDSLIAAVWGIREPAPEQPVLQPDVLLAALLAFDDRGFRLGYGGGYYDRTINGLRRIKPLITIGLAFDEQRVDAVPHLDYDEPLDWILTPSGARQAVT
jgi:5-formyltetrahydrofolate cyclo-ligase